jgi:hypothetical protein
MDTEIEEMTVMAAPMGRRGTPKEMANVCAFLASDAASYVTGGLWLADGVVTIAKGSVGQQTPESLRQEPQGELRLDRSKEGLKNKHIQTVS